MIHLEEVTIEHYEHIKTYLYGGWIVLRISGVPESQREELKRFMAGQTMPFIDGAKTQDYIYIQDYTNFLRPERERFWD